LLDVEAVDIRLTDGAKVVSLTRRPPFTPRKISGTQVDPKAIVLLEGLGKLKISTSSGLEPSCIIVPQPTTLPRAPFALKRILKLEIKESTNT
jgi:hypothetical protein